MNAKRRVKEARAPDRRVADATRPVLARSAAVLDRDCRPAGKYRAPIVLVRPEGKQRRKPPASSLARGAVSATSPPGNRFWRGGLADAAVVHQGCCRWPPRCRSSAGEPAHGDREAGLLSRRTAGRATGVSARRPS